MNTVSIVIKAYNEVDKIDAAIRSALRAAHEVHPWSLEVVVADGLSFDGTARRAARWSRHAPVRVVQLMHAGDRNCGSGVELGFAASHGDWVLLMDGDMVLRPGFLAQAIAFLQAHPRCAGVSGLLEEEALRNGSDVIRERKGLNRTPGLQPWLNGGGLYRREAVEQAGGYAGDERLAAYEEADLGLRLRAAGWNLFRLPIPAVLHRGHADSTSTLLWRRWQAGRFKAAGHLLRIHGGGPFGAQVWAFFWHPLAMLGLWCLSLIGCLVLLLMPGVAAMDWRSVLVAGAPVSVLALQVGLRRDWPQGWTSWLDWHLHALGILMGWTAQRRARRPHLAFRSLGHPR
jgi:glycosyltransferase involved in cell wall biosynthesis